MTTLKLTLKEHMTIIINERLSEFNGNQTKAAKSLDISRNTLRKYINPALLKPITYEFSVVSDDEYYSQLPESKL